jgi:p-aminobenzoyl-glutamate transporter AbgT
MNRRMVVEGMLIGEQRALYSTNVFFRSMVDNFVLGVIPAFLDGAATQALSANEDLAKHMEEMMRSPSPPMIIKPGDWPWDYPTKPE